MTNHRFSKRLRLLRAADFERVFAARSSAVNEWMTVYGAANELGHPRVGLVVSRRIGGAVARNRWKRLIREAFRLSQHQLPPLDLVCVARSPSPPKLVQLIESLPPMAKRIEERLQKSARRAAKREL